MKRTPAPALLLSALVVTVLTLASPRLAYAARGAEGRLTVGGGVAAPAPSLGLYADNPAGFALTTGTVVMGAGYTPSDSMSPIDADAQLLFGNGTAGLGVGFDSIGLNLGGALQISSLSTAIGFRARNITDPSIDLGFLIRPNGSPRFGAQAFGINGGIGPLSAGVAWDLGPSATFAVDAGFSTELDGAIVKPGLRFQASALQLMASYGFNLSDPSIAPIRPDLSLGLGFQILQKVLLHYYYSQIDRHYLGLQLAL